MKKPDDYLSQQERDLARAALEVAEAVENWEQDGDRTNMYWPEEHTTSDGEGELLSSTLYSRAGDKDPRAGFTLHKGEACYRVIITPYYPGVAEIERS